MVLSIKSQQADQLARELVSLTGETLTEAVIAALELRLADEHRRRHREGVTDIVDRFRTLPVLDDRTPEQILGYDHDGLPT